MSIVLGHQKISNRNFKHSCLDFALAQGAPLYSLSPSRYMSFEISLTGPKNGLTWIMLDHTNYRGVVSVGRKGSVSRKRQTDDACLIFIKGHLPRP